MHLASLGSRVPCVSAAARTANHASASCPQRTCTLALQTLISARTSAAAMGGPSADRRTDDSAKGGYPESELSRVMSEFSAEDAADAQFDESMDAPTLQADVARAVALQFQKARCGQGSVRKPLCNEVYPRPLTSSRAPVGGSDTACRRCACGLIGVLEGEVQTGLSNCKVALQTLYFGLPGGPAGCTDAAGGIACKVIQADHDSSK